MGILLASMILVAIGAALENRSTPDKVDPLPAGAGKFCKWVAVILLQFC
jgi:hypothetical protein